MHKDGQANNSRGISRHPVVMTACVHHVVSNVACRGRVFCGLNVEVIPMRLRGLRQARQRQGISISQLADLSDLRRETITRYEQGQEDAAPALIRRLSALLRITQAELINGLPHVPTAAPTRVTA